VSHRRRTGVSRRTERYLNRRITEQEARERDRARVKDAVTPHSPRNGGCVVVGAVLLGAVATWTGMRG
jgi:hypothetical protein